MPPPANPKIYHIVHIDRLPSIIADGRLWCDSVMAERADAGTVIGMNTIKRRRLSLAVKCWPDNVVGDYVPFYLCSRSVMLYVIHCANNPELAYRGGQGPIVHLEADLNRVIDAADAKRRRWALSLSNAGSRYAEFRTGADAPMALDWTAIQSNDFRNPDVKERKQAEFLLRRSFPWRRIERIGVRTPEIAQRVANILNDADHRPQVQITPQWYF